MTNSDLARSYMIKARVRLKILPVLLDNEAYSDVIRESQEIVELSLKALLRQVGVEPPKFHDVGPFLFEHQNRFPEEVQGALDSLASISAYLRKEREFSFYGDIDFIPTEQYSEAEARQAISDAQFVVKITAKVVVQ